MVDRRKLYHDTRCLAVSLNMRPIFISLGILAATKLIAAEPTPLDHLAVFLTGTFSNAEQARGDQNFANTLLHITPFWSNHPDGPWLYLEQSLADAPIHPYRQLVYQLASRTDGGVEVRVFDLRDPIAATGAWKDPSRLEKLLAVDLTPREGCTLFFELQPGGFFKGGTRGSGCANSLRGAAYSTVTASVSNLEITLWERGYNTAGTQVWGSLHGGYVFKRVE
jgi:CpeT protein